MLSSQRKMCENEKIKKKSSRKERPVKHNAHWRKSLPRTKATTELFIRARLRDKRYSNFNFFSSFTSFLSIFFFNCKTLDSFYTSSTICSQCSLAGIWLIKNFRQSLRFCVECDFSSDFTLPQVHFLCSPRRTFVCRCHLYTNRRREREKEKNFLSAAPPACHYLVDSLFFLARRFYLERLIGAGGDGLEENI